MIDLCVVSYNTKDKLKRLVDTLVSDYDEDNPVWKLYVSENGSEDGSGEYLLSVILEGHKYPETVIMNTNVGYAAACNGLAGMGDSDIVGLLNSDVWMTTDDIRRIEEAFRANPEISILGPKQRSETGHITHAGIFGSNTRPKHRGWHEYDPGDIKYRDQLEAVTVSGSAYFVRRNVWDALTNDPEYRKLYPDATGAFLPTPHYYEETWCSYFARHRGYKVFYDGTISIGHSWHASSDVGGTMDRMFPVSQKMFRDACDAMNIPRD